MLDERLTGICWLPSRGFILAVSRGNQGEVIHKVISNKSGVRCTVLNAGSHEFALQRCTLGLSCLAAKLRLRRRTIVFVELSRKGAVHT